MAKKSVTSVAQASPPASTVDAGETPALQDPVAPVAQASSLPRGADQINDAGEMPDLYTPAELDASPVDPVSTTGEGDVAASSEGAGKNTPAFPTYEVIAPLRHDGHRYAPGDLVALTPERAARLIGLRVVELIEA